MGIRPCSRRDLARAHGRPTPLCGCSHTRPCPIQSSESPTCERMGRRRVETARRIEETLAPSPRRYWLRGSRVQGGDVGTRMAEERADRGNRLHAPPSVQVDPASRHSFRDRERSGRSIPPSVLGTCSPVSRIAIDRCTRDTRTTERICRPESPARHGQGRRPAAGTASVSWHSSYEG